MTATGDEKTTQVTIFGRKFHTLKGRGGSEEMEKIAALVDRKMREISAGTSTVDSLKVAILAALNIADEYQRYRERWERDESALAERAEACCRILDAVLDKA